MSDTQTIVAAPAAVQQKLFSLSYKGFSGRKQMFCMLGWYFFLKAVLKIGGFKLLAAGMLDFRAYLVLYSVPVGLFVILFVFPLYVRRARQMGAVWYGVLVIVLHVLPLLGAAWLAWLAKVGSYEGDPCARVLAYGAWAAVIASLPLYVYGGKKAKPLNTSEHENAEER